MVNPQLCELCKVVQIDDKLWGGHVASATNDYGHEYEYVEFEEEVGFRSRPRSAYQFSRSMPYQRQDFLPHLPDLTSRAKNGCSFCWLLLSSIWEGLKNGNLRIPEQPAHGEGNRLCIQGLQYHWVPLHAGGYPISWDSSVEEPTNALAGVTVELYTETPDQTQHLYFQIYAEQGPCASWLRILDEPPSEDFLSERSLSRMKFWISRCVSFCRPAYKESAPLPTRLIDVGGPSFTGNPRLIICQNDASLVFSRPEYAALSYSWGEQGPSWVRTTEDTLSQHLNKIPLVGLPRTCSDAIQLTRRLGIRYLWIDALCIVQGNSEDWEVESSRMCEVYQHACVTLVSMSTKSCEETFLEQSRPVKTQLKFTSSLKSEAKGTYWIRNVSSTSWKTLETFGIIDWGIYNDVSGSHWTTRGWTFQEKALSHSMIYFGKEIMYFQCGPWIEPENRREIRTWFRPSLPDILDSATFSIKECYNWWYGAISSYGDRNLKFLKDRLPAISGIAKLLQQRTKNKYLAGLWQSSLHLGLLWHCMRRKQPDLADLIPKLANPTPYIAPSWSWAREKVYVQYLYSSVIEECVIVQAETIVEGLNPFGRCSGGYLVLRGRSFSLEGARLGPKDRGGNFRVFLGDQHVADCMIDWKNEEIKDGNELGLFEGSLAFLTMFFVASMPPGYCNNADANNEIMAGLLLLPKPGTNEWLRVGMFTSQENETGGRRFFEGCETRDFKIV